MLYAQNACVGAADGCWIIYLADIKLARFQSQFEASHVSNHTDELCYLYEVYVYMSIFVCVDMLYLCLHIHLLIYTYVLIFMH